MTEQTEQIENMDSSLGSDEAANSMVAEEAAEETTTLGDRLSYGLFLGGIAFLGIVVGMLMAVFNTKPYRLTVDAISAARAFVDQQRMSSVEYSPWLWQVRRFDDSKTTLVENISSDSVTLFTSGADPNSCN